MENLLDDSTLKAIKQCVAGLTLEETTSEYVLDDETGKMKLIKQKKVEKNIPPNTDIIKLIYTSLAETKPDYNKLTDEELEQAKQRLLKELKEKGNDSRTSKSKS